MIINLLFGFESYKFFFQHVYLNLNSDKIKACNKTLFAVFAKSVSDTKACSNIGPLI